VKADCIPRSASYYLGRVKNVLNKAGHPESGAISAEALVGLGITIGALGILCLLLGWAEQMRAVQKISALWLTVGAVMVVLGGIMVVIARSRALRENRRSPK
jgi:hypothetical protein